MNKIYGAIAAGALYAASALGCTNVAVKQDSQLEQKVAVVQKAEQDSYSAKGNQEKVVYLRDQLKAVKKDNNVNPNEISTIETTVARAEQLSKSIKGEDAISKAVKAEADSIAKDGNQYKTALLDSNQLETYVVMVYHEEPGNEASSVKIFGVYENDHTKLEGKLAEQAKVLGFSAEKAFAKRATKDSWGYSRGTKLGLSKEDRLRLSKEEIKKIEERQQEFLDCTTWIDNPDKLTQYFPASKDGKQLSCSVDADTFSEKRYTNALTAGQIRRVGVQTVMRTLEPVKKKDKKAEAPKAETPKAEVPKVEAPKVDDAAAKAAAEKAKADAEAKATAERKAAEAKAASEKSAAEKAKKTKDLGDIDTYVEK